MSNGRERNHLIKKPPVYITKNGTGDMVIMSIEEYERQQALIGLYTQ
ncbi:type II toxin-antitoxin system prevent-host-death family antitoxin [Paenibacillus sp. LMG 31456]|uniref:Antitoxin n=1 Tax=Paenibacillus foliorum TaxID=2654974 RepID=A0A972K458_9BACL|nr:type II toxin-antitoxin system prevent-host-death family antitoxin [Paenibacillus foliorum]